MSGSRNAVSRPASRWMFRTLLSVSVAGGLASPVLAESLRDALASTYRYNPQLDAERARLRATDEDVARAMSGYRPVVTGGADINYSNQKSKTNLGQINRSTTYPKGYDVTLVQPIFNGFQTTNAVRESEAFVRAGRETLRAVEQQVLLDAVTAYMDVIRDQAIVRLRENNVNVLTRELKATQDRFAVGEVTRTDVAQSEARRALSVSALDLARANLKTSRATFEQVVGHAPTNLVEPSPNAPGLPASLDAALAAAAQENPNVIASLYREQASRSTVDRIRGELLPQIQLEAGYGRRFDLDDGVGDIESTEATTVTGRLSVPIYEGGEVRARIRQAKETHVSLLQEIEQFRTQTQSVVTSSWSQLVATRAQRLSDQTQVDANQTALAGVREEEKVGQRTLLDVLNAEQELLNAQVQLVTTQRNLVVTSYNVVAAIGRLDALATGSVSEIYDPEAHYKDVRREWWSTSITHGDGAPRSPDNGWSADVQREPSK